MIIAVFMVLAASVSNAQVKTASGTVRGASSADGRIQIYKGIPYAAPPVGELRWKAPRPAAAWEGVRDATEFGRGASRDRSSPTSLYRKPPSEDCLTLNVWTPAKQLAIDCR